MKYIKVVLYTHLWPCRQCQQPQHLAHCAFTIILNKRLQTHTTDVSRQGTIILEEWSLISFYLWNCGYILYLCLQTCRTRWILRIHIKFTRLKKSRNEYLMFLFVYFPVNDWIPKANTGFHINFCTCSLILCSYFMRSKQSLPCDGDDSKMQVSWKRHCSGSLQTKI